MKNLGSCNKHKGRVCAKKRKSVSIVKGRKREGVQVHTRIIEERVHQTLKVASNNTSVFHRKEGW